MLTGPHIGALGHDGLDGVSGELFANGDDDALRWVRHEREHAGQYARQ